MKIIAKERDVLLVFHLHKPRTKAVALNANQFSKDNINTQSDMYVIKGFFFNLGSIDAST